MMAISGSGWRAMGSTSFRSSAALFLAGADGGGAGFAGGAETVEAPVLVVWHLTVPTPISREAAKINPIVATIFILFERQLALIGALVGSGGTPQVRALTKLTSF